MVERVECVLGVLYEVLERSLVGFIYLFLCSFAFLIRYISVWCVYVQKGNMLRRSNLLLFCVPVSARLSALINILLLLINSHEKNSTWGQ